MLRPAVNSRRVGPLDYERQGADPVAGVFRDDKCLVIRSGVNLSRNCLCCGRPATGQKVVKHLFRDMGGMTSFRSTGSDPISGILALIQLIILLIYLIAVIIEMCASRKRTVTFGLCAMHQQQRKNLKKMILASLLGAVATISLGIGYACHLSAIATTPEIIACISSFVGAVVMFIAATVAGARLPNLKLIRENNAFLWVKGAGEAFLKNQVTMPALPKPAKK